MTPAAAFQRLNKLLWADRLPKISVSLVDNATLPTCYGLTLTDDIIKKPIILLNSNHRWGKTLVHEMLHVAEPNLNHGKIFYALVDSYLRFAKQHIKGLQ